MTKLRIPSWPAAATGPRGRCAMLVAVMVITVVAVLSTSVAVLATRSTRAAGETRTAGVVKDLANAGLAEGVTFLRQVGVTSAIDAQPSSRTVPTRAWPQRCLRQRRVDQGQPPRWSMPATRASTGSGSRRSQPPSGGHPGAVSGLRDRARPAGQADRQRRAEYTPAAGRAGPYAVYGKGDINLQSAAQVISNMSVYSETCIDRKGNKQTIGGTDLAAVPAPRRAHA